MDPSTLRKDGDMPSVLPSESANTEDPPAKLKSTQGCKDDRSTNDGDMSSDDDDDEQYWVSPALIEAVKIAVYHLLDHILDLYRTDECNGCKINHPSQREHECLRVLEDYFYAEKYYSIRKNLITPRFIPSIKRFLFDREIEATDAKVGVVADTLLYELQSERQILDAISKAYDTLVGDDGVKQGQLEIVTEVYKSNVWWCPE